MNFCDQFCLTGDGYRLELGVVLVGTSVFSPEIAMEKILKITLKCIEIIEISKIFLASLPPKKIMASVLATVTAYDIPYTGMPFVPLCGYMSGGLIYMGIVIYRSPI